jgi:hypothetical protein
VAVLHALEVTLVLLAMVCLPCIVAVLITADALIRAARRRARRARRHWAEQRLAVRAGIARGLTWGLIHPRVVPVGPPIEQLAADLRRLSRQRADLATRSPVWFTAVSTAYDSRLSVACQELEITEHLHELAGLDREIERVRVEGLLLAAGLRLHGGAHRPQDQT